MHDPNAILSVNQLSYFYPTQKTLVLDDISFHLEENQITGILGPNGSGKSTLLKLINAILIPPKSTIFFWGKSLESYSRKRLSQKMAMVFQHSQMDIEFNCWNYILTGRHVFHEDFFFYTKEDLRISEWVMNLTDTQAFRSKNINQISQGERQRVALAASLAQQPQLLLLDEPTASLDIKHQVELLTLIETLTQSKNITVLMTIHDINLAARFCKKILLLKAGKIVKADQPHAVLTKELLESVFETPIQIRKDISDSHPYIIYGQ